MSDLPLENIELAATAMRREGKDPHVVSHSTYWGMTDAARAARDWLVLRDETYERFLAL